jgi:hypothetical protein
MDAGCSCVKFSYDSWLILTSLASGSGNGTLSYSVKTINGLAWTVTITITIKTFTVNQLALYTGFTYGSIGLA